MKKKGSIVLGKEMSCEASYARLIRFFKIPYPTTFILGILQLLLSMLQPYLCLNETQVLSLDRTNWKLGIININILVIGLVLSNGRFVPLFFELLDKRGNSNEAERIELLEGLRGLFGSFFQNGMQTVLVADREFIGKKWFDYLKNVGLDIVIRLRIKDYRDLLAQQMGIQISELDDKIRGHIAQKGYFVQKLELKGKIFYYHVLRIRGRKDELSKADKDIYIRFLSTRLDTKWVCVQYDKRWKIEVFFEDIKEKGFRLEQINFTQPQKIKLMVAVASLCYALCLIKGTIEFKVNKPRMKWDKNANQPYPTISIFTRGYELIEQAAYKVGFVKVLINSFIKPYKPINQIALLGFSSIYFRDFNFV